MSLSAKIRTLYRALWGALCSAFLLPGAVHATVYSGDPSNYKTLLSQLAPGDTLRLAAGNYVRLTLDGIHGTAGAWITIAGPASGAPAVIQGESCCNTVQFYGSSFVAIRNLSIDCLGLDVDAINAKSASSHHILIESCTLYNFGSSQQTVGISTKTACWNWIVRGNTILDAGTGMYFGNSDGSAPFIAGVIEGNLVRHPVGYCIQVKYQTPYSTVPEMPTGPSATIIRNNVLLKDDRPSPDGSRPNLLVDGFPDSGPGSADLYEIYGNFLFYNSRESLFQGSGRMTIHDNILVGAASDQSAIYLTDHDAVLKLARVYNNTIYGGNRGVNFVNAPRESGAAVGNLIFATTPINLCGSCGAVVTSGNVDDAVGAAGNYVNQPSTTPGSMDFYPKTSCVPCSGAALDLSPYSSDADYDLDFNGTRKGTFTVRGAYAGSGTNPGWSLNDALKLGGPSSSPGTGDPTSPSAITDLRAR